MDEKNTQTKSADPLIPYFFRPRRSQIEALDTIATRAIPLSEHIRRAIDMYLSQPAIQDALVELEKEPEANSA